MMVLVLGDNFEFFLQCLVGQEYVPFLLMFLLRVRFHVQVS